LNKVLGRDVYTSNLQLGGTQIMYRNGISHLIAANDLEGASQVFNWLSYIPKCKNATLPLLIASDYIGREVETIIHNDVYDPRDILAGYMNSNNQWINGFFDKDSFTEYLGGWAKGVVVARARLGGIPMGVIAVETRSTEQIVWADPADENSTEQTNSQAGQGFSCISNV
jgi:acetyl-CoA carboxylase/biotin carboxylase 1